MLFEAPALLSLSPCFDSCPTCIIPDLKTDEVYEKCVNNLLEDVYISLSAFLARFLKHLYLLPNLHTVLRHVRPVQALQAPLPQLDRTPFELRSTNTAIRQKLEDNSRVVQPVQVQCPPDIVAVEVLSTRP